MSAKNRQVSGNHYQQMQVQPIDYITRNGLNWFQGNIVKYATRYPFKGCPVDDLRKIIHYAELALEAEGGDAENDFKPWAEVLDPVDD